jgi:flavorubredoxin
MARQAQRIDKVRRIFYEKVIVAYTSRTGKTEEMANYIAEGIRFSGKSSEFFNEFWFTPI